MKTKTRKGWKQVWIREDTHKDLLSWCDEQGKFIEREADFFIVKQLQLSRYTRNYLEEKNK